jgi:hypothetical protein
MLGAMRSHRRLHAFAALAVVAALTLSACGGNDNQNSGGSTQQKSAAKPVPRSPITGLPLTSTPKHPIMGVKIDNSANSAPQVGLSKADMVVEELVEGGLTRLAAFYYSSIPDNVGPIRSMRASDIDVVSPVHATMVTSGAAGRTIARIRGAHIPFYGEGSPGMYRSSERAAPYNLFVHLNDVAKAAKAKAATPANYLQWGDKHLPKGIKVTTIGAQFSGGHTTQWKFENGSYHNLNSNAPAGDQFPATNVLVLRVREGNAGYLDPAGNPVPETLFTGKGNALLFHDGRMIAANWHKGKAPGSRITLTTKKGQKLEVPAGHTWIELVPVDGGNVVFRK